MYARYGYRVIVTDIVLSALKPLRERARPTADALSEGTLDARQILAKVEAEPVFESAVVRSFFVHEVIHENLEAKQQLFAELDQLCDSSVVLGTNTSSFPLTAICEHVRLKNRVIGVHYITPAHIIQLVELIAADFTPRTLIEWGHKFLKTIDHVGSSAGIRRGFWSIGFNTRWWPRPTE